MLAERSGGHPDRGGRPRRVRRHERPPGAVTRASSSKNGIMLRSTTRSKDRSGKPSREASATSNLTRAASSGGSSFFAAATICGERSTPTTSASGNRSAASLAAFPVPVPRSSARVAASTRSSAATSGASASGPSRTCSQLPATVELGAQRPAEERPERRPHDHAFVTRGQSDGRENRAARSFRRRDAVRHPGPSRPRGGGRHCRG